MEHPSFYGTPGDGVVEKLWNYVTDSRGVLYLFLLVIGTLTSLVFFLAFLVGWWGVFCQSLASGAANAKLGSVIFLGAIIAYFVAVTGPIIGGKYRLPMEPIMTIFVVGASYRFTRRGLREETIAVTNESGRK